MHEWSLALDPDMFTSIYDALCNATCTVLREGVQVLPPLTPLRVDKSVSTPTPEGWLITTTLLFPDSPPIATGDIIVVDKAGAGTASKAATLVDPGGSGDPVRMTRVVVEGSV